MTMRSVAARDAVFSDEVGILGNLTREPRPVSGNIEISGDVIRSLKWERLKVARKQLPGQRVAKCHWLPINYLIEIWKNKNNDLAHYRQIFTCGSVWHCPVCAQKVTAVRRVELQEAIGKAKAKGWGVYFVTYTIGHKEYHPVKTVLQQLQETIRKVKSGRFWQLIKSRYGLQGSIIALEVTFSKQNGTHAHKHEILFTDRQLSNEEISQFKQDLLDRYMLQVVKVGGYAERAHAVDFKHGDDYLAEYIAKYGHDPKVKRYDGISREITSWHTKGRSNNGDHFTAFQLLDLLSDGDEWARDMFQEYAGAFKGRKQLTWSNGLKAKLGITQEEQSDEDIAADADQVADVFAAMIYEEFKKVRDHPFEVLAAAKKYHLDEFIDYMLLAFGATVAAPEGLGLSYSNKVTQVNKPPPERR